MRIGANSSTIIQLVYKSLAENTSKTRYYQRFNTLEFQVLPEDFKTLLRKIVFQRILLSVEERNFHHGKDRYYNQEIYEESDSFC